MVIAAAIAFCLIAAVLRENIGSGRFIYNPLRELMMMAVIGCALAYVWLRSTRDSGGSRVRGWVLTSILLLAAIVIYSSYSAYNAVRVEEHFSPKNPYFQFVLVVFAVAGAISAAKRALRWRSA